MGLNEILTEREKLKKWLKHGDISSIAEACGVDRKIVYRWFLGVDNPSIELVVKRMVEFRKEQATDAANKVTNQ